MKKKVQNDDFLTLTPSDDWIDPATQKTPKTTSTRRPSTHGKVFVGGTMTGRSVGAKATAKKEEKLFGPRVYSKQAGYLAASEDGVSGEKISRRNAVKSTVAARMRKRKATR